MAVPAGREGAPAYINVVGGGLIPATGGTAYDTHIEHIRESSTNAVHFFIELRRTCS